MVALSVTADNNSASDVSWGGSKGPVVLIWGRMGGGSELARENEGGVGWSTDSVN